MDAASVIAITGAVVGLVSATYAYMTNRRAAASAARAQAELEALAHKQADAERTARRPSVQPHESAGAETEVVRTPADLPEPDPPLELIEAMMAGECVLFAGAELLYDAGYPRYPDILMRVLDQLERRRPLDSWSDLRARVQAGDVDLATELIRTRITEDELQGMVLDLISDIDMEPSAQVRALADLPFSGVVTDDWSGLVLRAFGGKAPASLTPWRSEGIAEVLRESRFFVVEAAGGAVHGRLVLTSDDYQAAVQANRDYARFFAALFSTRSLLFVGASITSIEQFFRSADVRAVRENEHWAVLPWLPDLETRTELLRARYGVELIVLPPSGARVGAVADFVERLRTTIPDGAVPARPAAGKADRLERVVLRNIGPFDELELDLAGEPLDALADEMDLSDDERARAGRRTIVLGDNGSGKSSVLRAIALALAGESVLSARMAQRMLKTKAPAGEIELTLGGVPYVTRLLRDGPRVRVESKMFTPVQTATWLAIGFPAMRGVSAGNPEGPTTDRPREPAPDDLMPLLADGPDYRLDSLKQWVINTDVRSKDPERPDADRQGEMLATFFRVLGDLTPGVEFTYAGVDRDTWTICLDSPDGTISFDLLSRGMTAILGWIGVLLQRLYEVHGDAKQPEKESALVLVDEIDVHLHPEWQREILLLLESHFPGVQLVATTHSPLVVGNVRPLDVVVLRRDRRQVVQARRIDASFMGWRSDQILTSPAFGLTSTKDAQTTADVAAYRGLMAQGRTPDNDKRAAELYTRIEGNKRAGDTSHAKEGQELLREWLDERVQGGSEDERQRIVGEALMYLERLQTGSDR